ncbi:MAG: amidohydrolase [Desulfobacterales bacterium]|nr:amidohydrolase [Desulfobacterales bacterium]
MNLKEEIKTIEPELIALRRDFHMYPELGFEEFRTQEKIIEYLESLGGMFRIREMAKTGVVADLAGVEPGPVVMLRADIDALPVTEETGLSYQSVNEGKMHACGHDGHIAMMLGAAKILSGYRDRLKGHLKFVFQPNEEGAGAEPMIEEGVMENPRVDCAIGAHIWSPLPAGRVGFGPGPVMALSECFELTVKGRQGHTANPHLAVDPIAVAAGIITATQSIQAREINPLQASAVVFGRINAGSTYNIIPSEVSLAGTIRYLFQVPEGEEEPRDRFERIVKNTCSAFRADYELRFLFRQEMVVSDPELTAKALPGTLETVGGPENVEKVVTMIGEDFSEFGKTVPTLFYFIGSGNPEKGCSYPHHHPRFDIDESSLAVGTEMHVRGALALLDMDE